MKKALIIIPTYDEKNNVRPISEALLGVKSDLNILFVDDNSPDGTGKIIDEMHTEDKRINVIHRPGKSGLGRAYITGFKWAIENGYDFIFEMDADFSHDPAEIPNFLKAAENADLVLGSRYMHGIRITNWPLSRLILSKSASIYVRLITGMPISDPTGGFKCYRKEVLTSIDLDTIDSNGYSFQIEMKYNAWLRGFRIAEIPITFVDRRSGYSKMNTGIVSEALWEVWKLAMRNSFRRTPRTNS
ncbi:MAG: dolichyl-phosphate beta-D-mannosyltransferase [Lentisphaerae bacterium RIFOXYA12_FULL_48_11]|nr:MAG: dolichyl-phosphate beta-D-mannosyltransferase [Lentisphaerae bacterium RIFOXYA12_FULL_48_11]